MTPITVVERPGPSTLASAAATRLASNMEIDRNGLEVLDRDECIRRLRSVPIARIGLSMRALPVILPVNFVVDGDAIVIRTNIGTKVEAALAGTVVAFEVDDYDTIGHAGWSVLVRGRSQLIEDPHEIVRLHGLWVTAWGTPHTDRWMAITMEVVSGRQIRHDVTRRARPAEFTGSDVVVVDDRLSPAPTGEPQG